MVYLVFLLGKARQAKMEHMEIKILQPIFGILTYVQKYVMSQAKIKIICPRFINQNLLYSDYDT